MCNEALNAVRARCRHACLDSVSKQLPFCNPQLPLDQRLDDLISRLSLDEKLGMLGPDTKHSAGKHVSVPCRVCTQAHWLLFCSASWHARAHSQSCGLCAISADDCSCMTGAVPRLGIPGVLQIVETNSAVASCVRALCTFAVHAAHSRA